ncbi:MULTISPECIES: glycoside hydrolase family 38 C-terminal domain-containing protein [unclassified Curtobacterium]|uniref:alpha-mannosidase n=1 Tax=unclassified Curtobacterium TaxID=257496 RepID=UPI000D8C9CA9|nr:MULTISPECIES: glycoside hydrolase family 38 C-terminal domain-containing protein [unclassified Curtobacterium]PYY41637.1 alpha-mannosidase [Curtobacterium sp. MCPF17_046]WIB15227.1 glycoside hydrolase family 38 C-terminal domain-containing protein [Curtobacterium sp. MCPF17_050]
MHQDEPLVEARIARLVRDRVDPNVHRRASPVTIEAWQVPDEPVPFAEAVQQTYTPFTVGEPWGARPWGTTWFRVTGTVPADFGTADGTTAELLVDLGFSKRQPGFQAEGLAFRPDGSTIKAIEPRNDTVPLQVGPGESFELYVEAGANPDIGGDDFQGATPLGSKHTAGDVPIYRLRALEVVERDDTVWELQQDLWVLRGLMAELPTDGTRGADVLRVLERAADALDPDDVAGTAADARAVLATALAVPASAAAHRAIAVGHAHIDSAWLWPVRETKRKCARTFSNVLDLMDRDPDFTFACSSAQQYAWMRDEYPEVFGRIKQRVAEGRWIPVGGMWVESDTNLPGGEALARQFVAGKRFFLEEFGIDTPEAWLPDSFGYTGALPQIVRAAGSKWFVTQKPSWNETNVIPHTSFLWEGIDGSRVLTHLPPADTYNSDVSPADLHRGERQNKERGVANTSMLLYGFGDGGGGPTREMVAAARRQHDLDGSPRVDLGTPAQVFEELEQALPTPGVWSGEMYLEFHRGTYTSQVRTKQGNRRSEHLLREAELWASTAAVRLGQAYPYDELESAWHTVLLQQFHDILPGSSIAWVYENAEAEYARVAGVLEELIGTATSALATGGTATADQPGGPAASAPQVRFNASPVVADGVTALGAAPVDVARAVPPEPDGDRFVFDTGAVVATVDAAGHVVSFVERASGRDAVAPGAAAAEYTVFRDTPNQWEAWDIDRAYQRHGSALTATSVTVEGDALVVVRPFGSSTVTTRYTATEGQPELVVETEVDWHEQQKLLKLAFPLDLKADQASSEIQFGHIDRPTHQNTSWDFARFETSAHRWVHVAEPGFGVAIANDSTYGHDVTRSTRADGGTTTQVRESLVRGPKFPDPEADQGHHVFRTVLRVGASVLDAADSGYRLNLPVRTVPGDTAVEPLVTVSSPQVFVEAVKLAEDRSGDVVVRLYEALGGRATDVGVDFGFDVAGVTRVDLLERPLDDGTWEDGGPVVLTLRPFEIVSLRVRRA